VTRTIQRSGPPGTPAFGLSADLFGVDAEADARREVMLAAAAVRLINYFVPTTARACPKLKTSRRREVSNARESQVRGDSLELRTSRRR
jgi:hypothetical protein